MRTLNVDTWAPPVHVGLNLDRHSYPQVKSVVPVVRWAILVRHSPHLTKDHPEQVLVAVKRAWGRWQTKYRDFLAQQAGLATAELEFAKKEEVRLKVDGKTPMLDLPRVQTRSTAVCFDVRNCVALCLDEYSSKVWTRLGLPTEQREGGISTSDLRGITASYRGLARSTGDWFFNEFYSMADGVFEGIERQRIGAIEITTVGLQVEGELDEGVFESWLLDGANGPNLDNDDLCHFISEAADLDFHPRELREREPESFWMSLPSAVRLGNGDLVSRTVLYLVRPVDHTVQVVGVGLDDSSAGELASHVALKVSRLVANRI